MQSCGFVAIFVLASFAIVLGAETTTISPMAVTTMADVNATTAKENSTATSEQMNNDAPQAASVPSVEPTRVTEKSTTKLPLVHTSPPETTPSTVGVSSSLDGSTNANIKTKGNGAFRASTGVAVIGSMILASLVLV